MAKAAALLLLFAGAAITGEARSLRAAPLQPDGGAQTPRSHGAVAVVPSAAPYGLVANAKHLLNLLKRRIYQTPEADVKAAAADVEEVSKQNASSVFMANVEELFVSILLWIVLTLLFAYYYNTKKEYPSGGGDGSAADLQGAWKYSFFGCFETPSLCLLACCCPAVRWADTLRMGGLLGFWVGVAVMLVVGIINATAGMLLALIMAGVGAFYRQKIRLMFGIEQATCETFSLDLLAYCCCPVLAIVQEARTMEEAYATGSEAVKEARQANEAAKEAK